MAAPGLRSLASVSIPPSAATSNFGQLESQVVSELDRQADLVFQDFQKTNPQVPFSILKHAQREAVHRLKQMHVITDILKASGPSAATTLIAAEVLTNFVLAPIATAFGKPAIAGVIVVVPWGLIAGFGVFSYQMFKLKLRLARTLGVSSLRPLEHLRELVVGYDLKLRVSSIVYQSMEGDIGDVEFEVLRKTMDFGAAKIPGIAIEELEGLLKLTPEGSRYLSQIYAEKSDPSFYSALLLRYINSSEPTLERLMAMVRLRLPENSAPAPAGDLRQHLIGVSDVRAKIEREMRASMAERAGLKKRLKKSEISADDLKVLKSFLVGELARLRQLREALSKHEYSVLLDAQSALVGGVPAASLEADAESSADLIAIAAQARVKAGPVRGLSSTEARALICSDLFAVGF